MKSAGAWVQQSGSGGGALLVPDQAKRLQGKGTTPSGVDAVHFAASIGDDAPVATPLTHGLPGEEGCPDSESQHGNSRIQRA